MVFCYRNCSELLWEKIVLAFEENFRNLGLKARICKNFEITRTIYSSSEKSEQFLVTECFFVSKRLEQLEFKLEKIIGI